MQAHTKKGKGTYGLKIETTTKIFVEQIKCEKQVGLGDRSCNNDSLAENKQFPIFSE